MENNLSSKFTGGAFAWYFIQLGSNIVTIISLGLLYPVVKCAKMRWMVQHTSYSGKKLSFDGTAGQLYGQYLKWMILCILTFGLYYLFAMSVSLKRWELKHTHFEGTQGESQFTGTAGGLFGIKFVTRFVTIITLFLGSFWAHCYKERWFAKHQIIDGYRMEFDGTAMEYFGNRIKWMLLTVITFGIYIFWLFVKSKQWTVKHTHCSVQ